MRWRGVLLVCLAACSPTLDAGDAVLTCDDDSDCPNGRCETFIQRCVGSGDGTPLRLTSAAATSVVRVTAVFNQPVAKESVARADQTVIEPPLAISDFALDPSGQLLSFTTSPQEFGVVYTLTVAGLTSDAGDPLDAGAVSQQFLSFLGRAETAPPAIVKPADRGLVVTPEVELAWQPIFGARGYTVTLLRRGDPGPASLHSLAADTTVLRLPVPAEGTYDWTVRADVTTPGVVTTASFDRLIDAVYVACPAGGACSPRAGNGSQREPLQRISDGIQLAQQLGFSLVRVAARPDGSAYEEVLVLGGAAAITIDGGFDAAFAPSTIRAQVERLGTVMVARPATGELAVRNLIMLAQSTPELDAVSVEGGATISFTDVDIIAERPGTIGVALHIDGTTPATPAHVTLTRSTVYIPSAENATNDSSVIAVLARHVALTLVDSSVRAGWDTPSTPTLRMEALRLEGATSLMASGSDITTSSGFMLTALADYRLSDPMAPMDVIDGCRLAVGVTNVQANAVYIATRRRIVFRNSIVSLGRAGPDSAGVRLDALEAGSGPYFVGSSILVFNDSKSYGISSSAAGYVVRNSLISVATCTNTFCGGASPCLNVGAASAPSTLVGVMLACEAPVQGNGLGVTTAAELTAPSPDCRTPANRPIRCASIFTSGPAALDGYFASFEGEDGDYVTLEDGDYHLIATAPAPVRQSGVSTTGTDCGYADQSLACMGSAADAAGVTRAAPFSMGPYEY